MRGKAGQVVAVVRQDSAAPAGALGMSGESAQLASSHLDLLRSRAAIGKARLSRPVQRRGRAGLPATYVERSSLSQRKSAIAQSPAVTRWRISRVATF